jgi:hypothetical protein
MRQVTSTRGRAPRATTSVRSSAGWTSADRARRKAKRRCRPMVRWRWCPSRPAVGIPPVAAVPSTSSVGCWPTRQGRPGHRAGSMAEIPPGRQHVGQPRVGAPLGPRHVAAVQRLQTLPISASADTSRLGISPAGMNPSVRRLHRVGYQRPAHLAGNPSAGALGRIAAATAISTRSAHSSSIVPLCRGRTDARLGAPPRHAYRSNRPRALDQGVHAGARTPPNTLARPEPSRFGTHHAAQVPAAPRSPTWKAPRITRCRAHTVPSILDQMREVLRTHLGQRDGRAGPRDRDPVGVVCGSDSESSG